jgi:hypothetical protein
MSLRPFQFTILRLASLIVCFAIVFASTRSVTGPVFVAFFSFAPAFFMKGSPEDPGLLGCAINGFILFIGVVIAASVEVFLHSKLDGLGREASWLAQAALGLLWGAIVCIAGYSIAKLTKRYIDRKPPRPLPDDTCGPIIWRRLDGS